MKCSELTALIEERYPRALAAEWDNPGLLVGDPDACVDRVFLALDATDETIAEAEEFGADLIITHHPMIFRPVSSVRADDFTGRRIIRLIRNGMGLYAMHTNYDIAGMADLNAALLGIAHAEVLEMTGEGDTELPYTDDHGYLGYGRIGSLSFNSPLTLGDFAKIVKETFALSHVRVYGDLEKPVFKAAVSSGAGKSSLPQAIQKGADVLVTGDVDYHTAIDALMQGIAVIDAGHYGTEFCFIEDMAGFLSGKCPELAVGRAAVRQPYTIA